ncbi:3-keto-disaccharide hydrolase [Mucilaginibacter mali]|uniref:3-keto-disaccharide hydrolase n=1 Tax=Mucilaginibacter mali TaxID=2740462 RepID=UPI00191EB8B6|nr:DUF1080 domain-containing protein [Mucilaginibacter mali]
MLLLLITSFPAFTQGRQQNWVQLFNGRDLGNWDSYLGIPRDTAGKKIGDTPIGLNNDKLNVFTVIKQGGENVIRVSGECIGGISTRAEYENYHLQLQFKWGSWLQKGRKKKDSGLLYHSVGEQGADSGAWMRSQEFQIEEGDCGDYWGCAGAMADVPASKRSEKEYVFDPAGTTLTFSAKSPQGRHCIKRGDGEKAFGEWNTLDLYCYGDTSIHVVNGKVVMVLYHNSQQEKDQVLPLTKGKIQLQSEGAEVFYKDVKLQSINKLPEALLKN